MTFSRQILATFAQPQYEQIDTIADRGKRNKQVKVVLEFLCGNLAPSKMDQKYKNNFLTVQTNGKKDKKEWSVHLAVM